MVPIDAPPIGLETIITGLRAIPNFGGFGGHYLPHKMALADLCDTLGTAAELTRCGQCRALDDDGTMHGDNFDGAGFVAGCRGNGFDVMGKNVLLIGAGGAARAIAAAVSGWDKRA